MESDDVVQEVWLENLADGVTVEKISDGDRDALRFEYNGCSMLVRCTKIQLEKKWELWAVIFKVGSQVGNISHRDAVYLAKAIRVHYKQHGYKVAATSPLTYQERSIFYQSQIDDGEGA